LGNRNARDLLRRHRQYHLSRTGFGRHAKT
jgi:hypothetical protein